MTSFYDLKADLPGAKTFDFAELKGKVVLIVNVASEWRVPPLSFNFNGYLNLLTLSSGFTTQYTGLFQSSQPQFS